MTRRWCICRRDSSPCLSSCCLRCTRLATIFVGAESRFLVTILLSFSACHSFKSIGLRTSQSFCAIEIQYSALPPLLSMWIGLDLAHENRIDSSNASWSTAGHPRHNPQHQACNIHMAPRCNTYLDSESDSPKFDRSCIG